MYPLEAAAYADLERLLGCIDRVFPLPRRFRAGLPGDIAELSRLFTSGREDLRGSYLGRPALLSAYVRYFLPWNVYRLCRLLPGLELPLGSGAGLTDIGSGPLTVPLGLWISRPELRGLDIEFRCFDQTGAGLAAGKELFSAFVGGDCSWRITTIRAQAGAPARGPKAALVSAAQVFTEVFRRIPRHNPGALRAEAERYAGALTAQAEGGILIVEPGVPQSGETIAAFREAFLRRGFAPVQPCPHAGPCPFPGAGKGGAKWCHFAFDTQSAPAGLHRLSAAAGLPKERGVLSYLYVRPGFSGEPNPEGLLSVRVISDCFAVSAGGGGYGRYGCSPQGMVLITGRREELEAQESGALLRYPPEASPGRDPKTGAVLLPLRHIKLVHALGDDGGAGKVAGNV